MDYKMLKQKLIYLLRKIKGTGRTDHTMSELADMVIEIVREEEDGTGP